jgi:hypothetical protein
VLDGSVLVPLAALLPAEPLCPAALSVLDPLWPVPLSVLEPLWPDWLPYWPLLPEFVLPDCPDWAKDDIAAVNISAVATVTNLFIEVILPFRCVIENDEGARPCDQGLECWHDKGVARRNAVACGIVRRHSLPRPPGRLCCRLPAGLRTAHLSRSFAADFADFT